MAYVAFNGAGATGLLRTLAPRHDPVPTAPAERLSALEWLAVAVSRRDSLSSLWEPGRLSIALRALFGGRRGAKLADPRLEALRRVAVLSRQYGYAVPSAEVRAFVAAGFTPDQYELVVDSVVAERLAGQGRGWRA